MTGLIDYGVGNLFSLRSSLSMIGEECAVTGEPEELSRFDRLILPGVGAFGDAADKLRSTGLFDAVSEYAATGRPLMGICLGMQLLFEKSLEYGEHRGLGLIPGKVTPIEKDIEPGLKIPHIGWNALSFKKSSPIFRELKDGEFVYFVHSYHATECEGYVSAVTEYGGTLTAAAERENVFGCQFHPEKSGGTGLKILRAFCALEG